MDYALLLPIVVFLSMASGASLFLFWRNRWMKRNRARLRREARDVIKSAKRIANTKILDTELELKNMILQQQRKLEEEYSLAKSELAVKEDEWKQRNAQLQSREQEIELHLQQLTHGDTSFVKEELFKKCLAQVRQEATKQVKAVYAETTTEFEQAARTKLVEVMERITRPLIAEASSCILTLKDSEMKGRIIGRDGRNVRAFEALTGVDLLMDEMQDHVVISSHSPERRAIAKLVLERLIADGRIQPSRIEEFVREAKNQLETSSMHETRETLIGLGLEINDAETLKLLNKLKYRTSYAQNVFWHSVECAFLAALLAAEIGLDADLQLKAKRAAMLHDLGKATSEIEQESHAISAARILLRAGENPLIVNAVAAHHGQVKDESILAPIVRIVDSLSGARPGARRQDLQHYIKRLEDLEKIATSFTGVEQAYALQAGRELHVIVEPRQISDEQAIFLARDIATKIEEALKYAGEVKITVIRQTKVTSLANNEHSKYSHTLLR